MSFADLGLSDELLRAIADSGYTEPTPVQAAAITPILMNRDLVAIAQTGTGKTASFVLPMIDVLAHGRSRARMPRSLILEPTRELAAQVAENFEKYGKYHKLSMALLIGGVQMGDQVARLEKGVDVLIATPGRLMDLYQRGKILLSGCSILVIDEADRMLDMGFIPDIEEICTKLPATRQTLLFSATMPAPIKKLSDRFLSNPKQIEVARTGSASALIEQALVPTTSRGKRETLIGLLRAEDMRTAIIFANRKTTVRDLAQALQRAGFKAGEIHGDMDQSSRIKELDRFKAGDINILVASDVAARGLDVKGVSHVFNYDAPWHPDDYVHRIGRTGRAGATGKAFTLITEEDAENIANIEKLTGQKIPRIGTPAAAAKATPAPTPAAPAESDASDEATPAKRPARNRRGRGGDREAAPVAAPASIEPEQAAEAPAPRAAAAAPTPRAAPAPRPAPQAAPTRPSNDDPAPAADADEKWNGPVPAFLSARVED